MINMYLIIAFISVTIAAFSQILLKKGAMRTYESFIKEYLNLPVILGYGFMFLSVLATMFAYRGVDYMAIQIIEAAGYVLVPILSYIFFKEKLTKYKVVGIMIIIIGMLVYAM